MEYKLNCAQLRQMAPRLHAGDRVLLSGRVYTSQMRRTSALWLPWTPGSRYPMICKTQ